MLCFSVLIPAFQSCGPAKLSGLTSLSSKANDPNSAKGNDGVPNPMPTPQSNPTPPQPGIPAPPVHLRSQMNGLAYFSIPSTANGTPLEVWERVDSISQNYLFTDSGEIRVVAKCLEAPINLGAYIFLSDCNGEAAQKWSYSKTSGLLISASGYCAALPTENAISGTRVSLTTCSGQVNQEWEIIP